jgi:hypothetical protein
VRNPPAAPLQCGAPVGAPASWNMLSKRKQNNFKNPRLPVNRGFFAFAKRKRKILEGIYEKK